MMLLSTLTLVVAVVAFVAGWFRGYKKACDAHDWNLPSIDWNSQTRP
jgi:hypothetical protein